MAEKHRIRTEKYLLTLLPEESALLKKNAYEFDLSRAEYLRQLIVYGAILGRHWTMDKEQGKQLVFELNRIGNNLNQIAYNTNERKYAIDEDWKAVKENYFEFLELFGKIPFLEKSEQSKWKEILLELMEAKHGIAFNYDNK